MNGVPSTRPCPDPGTRTVVDPDSAGWLDALCGQGAVRDDAVRRLHDLLLRAARFQVSRARGQLARAGRVDLEELAQQAADDATLAVLDRLGTYAGRARFTTWAYKFAVLQTAVAVRRAAWLRREVPVEPTAWPLAAEQGMGPAAHAEAADLAVAIRAAVADRLTPHQRYVLVALAVNDVPVDVLAERLATTRGALYKTLHDARARVRVALVDAGFDPGIAQRREDR